MCAFVYGHLWNIKHKQTDMKTKAQDNYKHTCLMKDFKLLFPDWKHATEK